MAEEGNAEATTVTPPTPETAPLIDNEGNLRDGWTSILDEDLRGESFLSETKTIQGMARSVVSARSMVGKDKIVKPTEASSEEEWNEFHTAGGRPETAGDYAFARPEELPEEHYDQERANAAQELFHKLGLSKKQADALFAYNNNYVIAQLAKNAQESELAMTALTEGLQTEWGSAIEQKKHLGNVAIEEAVSTMKAGVKMVDQDFKARLVEKAGNDPDIIRAFANLGSKFAESGAIQIETVPTPADIQTTIDDEIAKPVYGPDYAKHGFTKAQHKAHVEKVAALFREKTKHVKTG